jgi:TonB family protein
MSAIAFHYAYRRKAAEPAYNLQREGVSMNIRICAVLCFAAALSITVAAQSEPVLVSANIPRHPPLACQARTEGVVKLTFVLMGEAGEPTNVEVISGHPMLKDAAIENVKTWKFRNAFAEGKYETTFDYRIASSGPQKVTFESFHRVEVATCLPVQWQP